MQGDVAFEGSTRGYGGDQLEEKWIEIDLQKKDTKCRDTRSQRRHSGSRRDQLEETG